MIANGLMEYGYSGVDENSKVCMLMNSINTNYLNACKSVILDIPDMQRDFDITARHLLDFITIAPNL